MKKLIKFFLNRLYRLRPPPMVNYWRHGDRARAKVMHTSNGSYQMMIEGEEYAYPGFPRGHILFGPLSRLKKKVKTLVFNDIWARLENNEDTIQILTDLKGKIMNELSAEIESILPDMIPPEKMCLAMKELWRAMTVVEKRSPSIQFKRVKQGLTFFLQEDDAYRFRLQWLSQYIRLYSFFKKIDLRTEIKRAIKLVEYAEVVPDMKGRITLIARIISLLLEDDELNAYANAVLKEINFKKMKLSAADKYYFRGKYFKVDHAVYDY